MRKSFFRAWFFIFFVLIWCLPSPVLGLSDHLSNLKVVVVEFYFDEVRVRDPQSTYGGSVGTARIRETAIVVGEMKENTFIGKSVFTKNPFGGNRQWQFNVQLTFSPDGTKMKDVHISGTSYRESNLDKITASYSFSSSELKYRKSVGNKGSIGPTPVLEKYGVNPYGSYDLYGFEYLLSTTKNADPSDYRVKNGQVTLTSNESADSRQKNDRNIRSGKVPLEQFKQFTICVPSATTGLTLVDEKAVSFTLGEQYPDLPEDQAKLKFKMTGSVLEELKKHLGTKALPDVVALEGHFKVKISGGNETKNYSGSFAVRPFVHNGQYSFKNRELIFWKPLYEIFERFGKNPYDILSEYQFEAFKGKEIGNPIQVTVSFKPVKMTALTGFPRKEKNIALTDYSPTTATFRFAGKIDLARESRLRVGKDKVGWDDYVDVSLVALKYATGAEGVFTVTSAAINLIKGDIGDALFAFAPLPVELILTGQTAGRLSSGHVAHTLEAARERLKQKGFTSFSNPSDYLDNFPLWLNLEQQRFVILDACGLVHDVVPPENLHAPMFSFNIGEMMPVIFNVSLLVPAKGNAKPVWMHHNPGYSSINLRNNPYLPTRIAIGNIPASPTPEDFVRLHQSADEGLSLQVFAQNIRTSKTGSLVLSNAKGEMGIVDLGWRDDAHPILREKPYACLISGKLHVKDFEGDIGVAFFEEIYTDPQGLSGPDDMQGGSGAPRKEMLRIVPGAWIQPLGTEYVVEKNDRDKTCQVRVLSGSVNIVDASGRNKKTIAAGQQETLSAAPGNMSRLYKDVEVQTVKTKEKKNQELAQERTISAAENRPSEIPRPEPIEKRQETEPQKGSLGLQIGKHDGYGIRIYGVKEDSPADHAGLEKGDLILEVERKQFYGSGKKPEALVAFLKTLPTDRPSRFYISRNQKSFEVWIKIPAKAKESAKSKTIAAKKPAPKIKKKAPVKSTFEQGKDYLRNKQYGKAADCFKRTISTKPQQSYMYLGWASFMLNRVDDAYRYSKKAYQMDEKSALSLYFLAVSADRKNLKKEARRYYHRYLDMNYKNKAMNARAQERVDKLDKEYGRSLGGKLGKGIFSILKETSK